MDLHMILVTLHLLGFAFGVGGATVSDVVFVRSIKDGKVTKEEYETIKTISKVVWTSVVLAIISGLWLLYLEYLSFGSLADVPRMSAAFFGLKMTAFAAVVINGIVFHTKVFPILKSTIGKSFRDETIRKKYGLFAMTGGISIVSWYTVFLSVALAGFLASYSYLLLLNAYVMIVLAAGAAAYLVINMHADETTPVQACKKVLVAPFIQKVTLIGLVLLVAFVAQLIYL